MLCNNSFVRHGLGEKAWVARHQMVSSGDLIVVRVDEYVAGWGIVEHIEVTPDSRKEITRCPSCRKTNHYRRKLALPNNKCNSCGHMFNDDEAIKTEEKVTAYKAYYANTWTEAARPVHRKELNTILEKSDSFTAIRPLDKTWRSTATSSRSCTLIQLCRTTRAQI